MMTKYFYHVTFAMTNCMLKKVNKIHIIKRDAVFRSRLNKFNLGLFHIIVGISLCHISHTLNLCSGIGEFTVESMFVGCQNFPCSWERNFVGGVIKKILINI